MVFIIVYGRQNGRVMVGFIVRQVGSVQYADGAVYMGGGGMVVQALDDRQVAYRQQNDDTPYPIWRLSSHCAAKVLLFVDMSKHAFLSGLMRLRMSLPRRWNIKKGYTC